MGIRDRYQLPVLITENGVSCHDLIALDGKVHDPDRIDFINRYLRKLREACDEGVPVMGYFLWSIIDNFEWAHGYHAVSYTHLDVYKRQATTCCSAPPEMIRTASCFTWI